MIAGILLAAGESTRMGRLKALLPWRGTTLVQSQLAAMAGLSPLIVVLGHRSDDLARLVPLPPRWERLGEGTPKPSSELTAGLPAYQPPELPASSH